MTASSEVTDEAISYLLEKALIELNIRTFDEYIKTVGVADGLSTIRMYKKRAGYVLLGELKKKMGLKGSNIDTLVIPMFVAQSALNYPHTVEGVITEHGAECKLNECLFKKARPEFCVTISHFTTDLICEAINPDYECIWTHHMTEGDPYCRYVYKKRNESVDLNATGRTVAVLPQIPMPEADRKDVKSFILTHFWNSTVEAFLDLRGSQEVMEHLLPVARGIGQEMGRMMVQSGPPVNVSVGLIGGMMDRLGEMIHQVGKVRCVTEGEFVKEVTDCPFRSFPLEMCQQLEAMFQSMVEVIDPEVEFRYEGMMTNGCRSCLWSLRRKGIEPTELMDRPSPSSDWDALSVLKLRLAKGEIDLDEYQKILRVLSEG